MLTIKSDKNGNSGCKWTSFSGYEPSTYSILDGDELVGMITQLKGSFVDKQSGWRVYGSFWMVSRPGTEPSTWQRFAAAKQSVLAS